MSLFISFISRLSNNFRLNHILNFYLDMSFQGLLFGRYLNQFHNH